MCNFRYLNMYVLRTDDKGVEITCFIKLQIVKSYIPKYTVLLYMGKQFV